MKAIRGAQSGPMGSGHAKRLGRRSALGVDYVLANTVRPAGLGRSRSLADELAPFGITVNTIPPGFIDTGENYEAFFQRCAETVGLTYDQFMANLIRRIPMNRFGRPEEVARSDEHTSELQSLMCFSYAVFCLIKYIASTPFRISTYLIYSTL